jgi:hypothetical protein
MGTALKFAEVEMELTLQSVAKYVFLDKHCCRMKRLLLRRI